MTDIEYRSARSWDEVGRTARAAGRAFSNRTPEEPFFHERMVDAPFLPLENVLLGVDGEEIATALCIYDRDLFVGGRHIRAGAIGPVFTLPEYRHEGHGTRLLDYCREFLEDKGYTLSHLSAGPGRQSFYRETGWRSIPSPTAVVDDPEPTEAADGDWIPVDPEVHVDHLYEAYRSQYRSLDGAATRPRVYWTDWIFGLESDGITEKEVALWDGGDGPEGYAIWELEDGTVTCHELATGGDRPDRFRRACWNRLAREGDRLRWKPPLGSLADHASPAETDRILNFMVELYEPEPVAAAAGADIDDTEAFVEHVSDSDWYWMNI